MPGTSRPPGQTAPHAEIALQALQLLGRWNRAAHLRAAFSSACSCCGGDAQQQHLEREALQLLRERLEGDLDAHRLLGAPVVNAGDPVQPRPAPARSLPGLQARPAGIQRPLGELMRRIVAARDPDLHRASWLVLAELEALIRDLEASI